MMDKKFFIQLLHKYNNGTATKEEYHFLLSYYKLFDSEPDVVALLSEEKREELKDGIKDNIWAHIQLTEGTFGKNIPGSGKRAGWFSIAAAILIILSAGAYFMVKSPGQNDKLIVRSSKKSEHRLLHLPDGSTVIVGAGSKLNYPSSFDSLAEREVYLEGQAYFDIKHNPAKPFVIHTGKVATTVLGTAFNIKAWPKDQNITVTVTRGKVRVAEGSKVLGIITPNQQITYNKEINHIVQRDVEASEYMAWKEEDLLLDNVTVSEAAELLADRFKVSIIIPEDTIRNKRFSTTFLKGESLEQVLKSICEFNEAAYTYDEENAKVTLYSK